MPIGGSGSPLGFDAMTEGPLAIQARIAAIQNRFGAPVSAPRETAAPTASSSVFASMLEQATASVSGARLVDGVPADLKAYGNGRAPASALTSVGAGDHKLWAPAAAAMNSLLADAQRAGVTVGVNDSYRSHDEQVTLARTKGIYGKGGLAAVPGTSNHGWGLSVDLQLDGRAQSWMQANAKRHGYVNDVPGEPWHWTFKPT